MNITTEVQNSIIGSEAKAIATNGPHGVNVVPISMARVTPSAVYVFDFFMGKTVQNIEANAEVAMSFWAGLKGIQIKGEAAIYDEGDEFDEGVAWVKEQNPDRVTRRVIKITPSKIYDISAGPEAGKEIK